MLSVSAPDGTTPVRKKYWIGPFGAAIDVYDANNHVTVQHYDMLDRLRQVSEFQGNNGSEGGYANPAVTSYSYSALDLLTGVSDAQGNATSMSYDTLGRKTAMSDPDMGVWSYAYDPNGALIQQNDAKGQTLSFGYDALDRLTSKTPTALVDAFDTNNPSTWNWSGYQTVPFNDGGNNVLKSSGTNSDYSANGYRNAYSLSHNTSVSLRFKVDGTESYAHFSIEANDSTYRRFGVIASGGTLYVQYIADGVNWVYPATLISNLQVNTWYVVQIGVDDISGFSVRAYQESNPAVQGSYQVAMPAGKSWRFHHWILRNTAYLDTYAEYNGPTASYSYDDSSAPNQGKGQRTAMSTALGGVGRTAASWQYDARGRTMRADHSTNVANISLDHTYQWAYNSADQVTAITYPNADVLRYTYDAAWQPQSASSDVTGAIVTNATYTALGQPLQRSYGNGITDSWTYNDAQARLTHTTVGTGNRDYSYDPVGNLTTIVDNIWGQTQNFTYDHRDRLLHAWTTGSAGYLGMAYDSSTSYDALGNLTSKTDVGAYSYGANGNGSGAGPHQARNVNGQSYSYDANGNLTSGGGRTYSWTADNQPATVISGGVVESYGYDADGARVLRMRTGVSGIYVYEEGLWEDLTYVGATEYYPFNGAVVAQRDVHQSVAGTLHGDHLGSVTWAFYSNGVQGYGQEYGPWGAMRAGSMSTTLNYTSQRRDDTGLLYYHARYYDPVLARFVSADSVVPGAGALAVWPSDGMAAKLFQQGGKDKDGKPTAPANPQTLNRYSYVENNPVAKTDPSGHCSGGSTWNNFASIFNGTCFQRGMAIMAHASTPGEWALGAFAAVGPSAAIALLTAGTFGLAAAAIAGSGLTTASTVGVTTEAAGNTAYEIAKEGGRNAGLLRTFSTRSLGEIQRGINSLEKAASAHLGKLADPGRYAERWDSMSPQEQEGLLCFWQKEVARYAEQAAVLSGLLKEKQGGP